MKGERKGGRIERKGGRKGKGRGRWKKLLLRSQKPKRLQRDLKNTTTNKVWILSRS